MSEQTAEDDSPHGDAVVADQSAISHTDAMETFRLGVSRLIASDPALSYLPGDVVLEEARLQLALHQGKAVTVFLRKLDDSTVPIPVMQGSRVIDLKRSIRLHLGSQLRRANRTMPVSWRHVWKSYHLAIGQTKLSDDNELLLNYGVGNRSEVSFIKKLRQESKGKRVRVRNDG
ncbi:U11/U12 small nuclear ribonucleoprotein 25 kDa protein-like [Sycon ciliatum]|uniref:U11/U12 small nuclear ribonucleoprotein 25 kDa protein-like n=1 Tax=Sycon ciliatum TaxID=27933 RepID=UPI0031F6BAB6|eukprot:scpid82421/ scgid12742/ U11/U12 small nuclear ribonucleoprotein 25 kDa protein; Minus-99 protein